MDSILRAGINGQAIRRSPEEGTDTDKTATTGSAALAGDPEIRVTESLMHARRWDLLSLIPLLAILALVALVGALVWGVGRADSDRARAALTTDALWVEQSLRFQMAVDEDMLVRLALDETGGADMATLKARARTHVATNPEVLSVQWLDREGRVIVAVPEGVAATGGDLVITLLRNKTGPARPVYGAAENGIVPMALRRSEGDGGILVAAISLPLMFERHIPWWIAERYGVRLTDGTGVLAERSRRPLAVNAQAHSISFDPPLPGKVLTITAYDSPPALGNSALMAAIMGLAAFSIFALLVVQRNAAHRRRAEALLRAEMAFRRSMEESLTVGLRAKDHTGRILYVNGAFCKLVGMDAQSLVGRVPPMPYWSPDRMAETLARQRLLSESAPVPQSFETRFRRADGTEIDVQVYEAPLIDSAGKQHGWLGSVIDITEAKAAARMARLQEESLARTARLVTLGEMASTLAHELNQPLGAIASYAAGGLNLIDAGQVQTPHLRTAFEKLAIQARRAGLIIRRIQDFVKKREPQLVALDLGEVAGDAIGLMSAEARERRIELEPDIPQAGLPPVLADRILIEQVIVNLIRNGLEAMAEGPRSGNSLIIRLRSVDGMLQLDVADRGPGIPPEIADRLYDPFISTKSQGMGMGLNICRSIVELLHGNLSHQANPGGGTIFIVRLPFAAQSPTESRQP